MDIRKFVFGFGLRARFLWGFGDKGFRVNLLSLFGSRILIGKIGFGWVICFLAKLILIVLFNIHDNNFGLVGFN